MWRPSDDDLWMFDITAWSKSTRSTPGLTARSNPRLSLPRPSTNREKIGTRKGDYWQWWVILVGCGEKKHTPTVRVDKHCCHSHTCSHICCSQTQSWLLLVVGPIMANRKWPLRQCSKHSPSPRSALSRLTPANPTSCVTVGYLLHFFSVSYHIFHIHLPSCLELCNFFAESFY